MARAETATCKGNGPVARRRAARQRVDETDTGLASEVRLKSAKSNGGRRKSKRLNGTEAARTASEPPPSELSSSGKERAQARAPRSSNGGTPSGDTRLRFQLASLLRVSDNIVSRAVHAYDRLFALNHRDQAEIYLDLGRGLVQQGKDEQALEALRKAAQLRPGDAEVLTQVGTVHLRQRAPQAALRVFERARQAGAETYELHKGMADALALQEDYEAALAELQRALELKPLEAEDHYCLGTILDRVGRYSDAANAFRKAIEIEPREVAYHQSLGFTLESMGKRRDAIKCFKRALELERPANRAGAAGAR